MEPVRLHAVEQQFEGQPAIHPGDSQGLLTVLKTGMAEFHPPSDILASSGYRRVSGMSLAYHVLEEAMRVSHWRSVMSSREGR
jgi:CO/xanthine dehydrogenase FAD-binding subunit